MTTRNIFSLFCIGLVALVEVVVGVVYLTASEIMPYHKEVLGVDWGQLEPGVRTMFVAFINAYGSGHFAVGISLGALVLFPMRQGHAWARWTALVVGLPMLATSAYISTYLASLVNEGPPWRGAIAMLLVFMLGIAIFQGKARS